LHDVEQRRDARHHILAEGRRRRQDMAVAGRQFYEQRRPILGDAVIVGGIIGQQYLGGAGDLRRRFGDRAAILAGDQDVDVAPRRFRDLRGGGHRVEGGGLQRPVVVFGNNENRHQITRASSLSLATSSATEPTLTPPCRFAGSSTFKVTRCLFS